MAGINVEITCHLSFFEHLYAFLRAAHTLGGP
jgi:hypothetical protein